MLQGNNGSGKSTLLKTIVGLIKRVEGKLSIDSGRITYVPQREPASMRIPMDIQEYVRLGLCSPWIDDPKQQKGRLDYILDALLLKEIQHLRIGECSAGQFQRTLFARAWLGNPDLFVLDEPSSSLDDISCQSITLQIQALLDQKCTVILATHDERLTGPHITQVLNAHAGRLMSK